MTQPPSLSGETSSGLPAEGFLPQNIIRRCSKCAAPLTVAERMFYFLEAIDAPPLCRPCLVASTRSQPSPLPAAPRPGVSGPTGPAPAVSAGRSLPSESPVDTAIRIYLREELERAKLTLAHVPDTSSRAQSVRGLYQDAYQQLSTDRLLDAIITVRDLREAIAGLEGAIAPAGPTVAPSPPTPPPAAEPVDATVKRARELASQSSPPPGEANP